MAKHVGKFHVVCLTLAVCVGIAIGSARADDVILNTGQQVSGIISRDGDQITIHMTDGKLMTVNAEDVKRVTLTGAMTPSDKSEVEWTKIKSDINKTDDLRAITGELALFIKNYPDVPLTKMAKQMLDQFNGYATQGFVKFHSQWIAADSRDAIVRQADNQAKLALTLYRSGKLADALDAAKQALKTDDQNITALALAGLATARGNQWVKAKEYFQKIQDLDSGNVLALNDLAIISFVQHRQAEALLDYKKALDAGFGNRMLLDNIVEALGAYKGSKDVPAYTDLVRAFTQAEIQMAAVMAQKGLVRYGSTWVTPDQKEHLLASVVHIQGQMADLDASYQHSLAEYQQLDQQYQQTANDYNNTLANVSSTDSVIYQEEARGYVDVLLMSQRDSLQARLNASYQTLQDLNNKRSATVQTIRQMKADADTLQAQLAAAQLSTLLGVQRMMEVGDDQNPPPPTAAPTAITPTPLTTITGQPGPAAPVPTIMPDVAQPSAGDAPPAPAQEPGWPAVNPAKAFDGAQ